MEIIVGKTAGFCYGVKRAVDGATKKIEDEKESIYCLGEIVHNTQVINKLKNLGVKFIENIEDAKGTVLIRAHGVPKEIYDIADKMNLKIEDYTCPNVLKIHQLVENYVKNDYFIFLVGSKNHPENIGTLSYCKENSCVIEKEEDISKSVELFEKTNKKNLLLIAQTTFSLEKFYKIEEILKSILKNDTNFVIKNTICRATELRQKETEELSKKVNDMIIIGGKNSSNTKKLYEIAKKNCDNTVLVETFDDLQQRKLGEKVGIMAGASTPKESIKDVINFLNNN